MAKKRQSRYERNPDRFQRVEIQKRDLDIIKEVLESRFLTTSQIQALFFGSASACKLRLQKLYHSGILQRIFAPVSYGSSEAVYCPTRKGVNLLIKSGEVEKEEISFRPKQNKVSNRKIQHELDINDIKIALTLKVAEIKDFYLRPEHPNSKKRPNLSTLKKIFCWKRGSSTWDKVRNPKKQKRKHLPVRPDLVFSLNETAYFLEVDRGTMTLGRFQRKLRGYREYFSDGRFRSKYSVDDFRVLTTAPSERRRNNLLERAIKEQGMVKCLFAVFDELIESPFGKVWIRGREYVELLKREDKEFLSFLLEGNTKKPNSRLPKKKRDKLVQNSVRKFNFLEI